MKRDVFVYIGSLLDFAIDMKDATKCLEIRPRFDLILSGSGLVIK